MKKVFIYVGHSNWGKSRALKIITGNNSHQKIVQIAQHIIRVRKMSNDDDGSGLLSWVKTFPRQSYDNFIIAFCPNFPPPSDATQHQDITLDIITELQQNSTLYFFVQEEKFSFPKDKITSQEITWLRNFGTVYTLSGQNPDTVRASEFLKFVTLHI